MVMIRGPEIERIEYWEGQRLRSRDFRDQIRTEAHYRWWHNRALHNTFGVRYGFALSEVAEGGVLSALKIGCGLAYDCFGRELISQTEQIVPVPSAIGPNANRLLLVVSYRETAEFSRRQDLLSACPAGSVLIEEPRFSWVTANKFRIGHAVPIASIKYEDPGRVPVLDTLFRVPPSRALRRPRLVTSATIPGDTPWELWSESVRTSNGPVAVNLGMQVDIDTSTSGFTETPLYFAWLSGRLWKAANIAFFPAPMLHIPSASYKQFRVRLWMPTINLLLGGRARNANGGFEREFINYAREQGLHICWIGIQCMPDIDCEPLAECECLVAPPSDETAKPRTREGR
ncbi:MAG: hypothetical protein WAU45_07915 [Blastocatellia bacterium]